jgi:hypothetical protein
MRFLPLASLFLTIAVTAQTPPAPATPDSPELNEMYRLDQSEREAPHIDWTLTFQHDVQRRVRLAALLSEGKVQTASDYYHAAMVYQHGQTPDDYLLAHLLAVTAISKGSQEARWLSAATIDRYLRSIWQPQVYGTQFEESSEKAPWTHETMNERLVTDSMRSAVCVISLAAQQKDLARANSTKQELGSSRISDCK